jgi:hypothetical protein
MAAMLGNWQFWAAVIVVVAVAHFVMGFIMPKLSGGGS